MDYVKHFNFTDRPFKNTSDGRYFYRSASVEAVLASLKDTGCPTLIHLKGRGKVGKTTVLKRLPVELRERFRVVLIQNPHMTLAEMLRKALTDLGHSHKFSSHTPEEELLGYFQNSVTDFLSDGYRLLVVIDSVEELSPAALDELYKLLSLEPQWRGLVYLLMCGTTDLPWPMVPDIMMEVKDLVLSPLSLEEVQQYVQGRLKAAGGSMCFNRAALRTLYEYSEGCPEVINQLAERALISAWSNGRTEVGPTQLKAAKASLDNPLTINYEALGPVPQARPGMGRSRSKTSLSRGGVLVVAICVSLLVALGIHLLKTTPAPEVAVSANPAPAVVDETDAEPATATPAAEKSPANNSEIVAPSLPTLPPQILSLPQGSLAMVINQDNSTGRLWQGGAKVAGLKAEVASPTFKNGGLYIFGRPRGQQPLIFQYPPSRNVPKEEAKILWPRVATVLPQNILPVMVIRSADFNRPQSGETLEAISNRVKAWVQSQQYRFADTTAELYANTFEFFELGQPTRTISKENFRAALNSEARSSGEVDLTISQPLIMVDPGQNNLVWAVFHLKYTSKLRNDTGIRVLIFEKSVLSHDNWLIVAELWLPERSFLGE